MGTRIVLYLALCAVVAAAPATSQPPPALPDDGPARAVQGLRGPAPQRAIPKEIGNWEDREVRALIEAVRMVRLSRQLGLDDEQTVLLMRRYEELKETIGNYSKERAEVLRNLRDLVARNAADDEIKQALDRLKELDRAILEAKLSALDNAGADLTPAQQAKLYVFMQDFEQDMRRLVERARQFRRGMGARMMERPVRQPGGPMTPEQGVQRDEDPAARERRWRERREDRRESPARR